MTTRGVANLCASPSQWWWLCHCLRWHCRCWLALGEHVEHGTVIGGGRHCLDCIDHILLYRWFPATLPPLRRLLGGLLGGMAGGVPLGGSHATVLEPLRALLCGSAEAAAEEAAALFTGADLNKTSAEELNLSFRKACLGSHPSRPRGSIGALFLTSSRRCL